MSLPNVRFIVEQGSMNQKEYCFRERVRCVLGRNKECFPMQTEEDSVSRHHCEFDINPPEVIIRELGSRNGTTINGHFIGQRGDEETPEQGRARHYGDFPLADGDLIVLGGSVHLRLKIEARDDPFGTRRAALPLHQRQAEAQAQREAEAQLRQAFGRQVQDRVRRLLNATDYAIGDPIGQGGMGCVLKGVQRSTNTPVAIKVIQPHLIQDQDSQRRFCREIGFLERLDHPHIVPFHGIFPGDDFLCIVLGFCDGGSLSEWVTQRGSWPTPKRAVQLVIEILRGLEYAHARGIVHRDLKPANILMQFDPVKQQYLPRIADFGLSRALDEASMTATGTVGGTPQFMPRQQAMRFKYAEPEVDTWAAAAILYYLLTSGQTPRDFPEGVPPMRVVLSQPTTPIRERCPGLPSPLAECIDIALTDRPKIGITGATEFRERLEKALAKI